jgi:hypothetical protein
LRRDVLTFEDLILNFAWLRLYEAISLHDIDTILFGDLGYFLFDFYEDL